MHQVEPLPREPEIEFLGKAVVLFLVALRVVLWLAGMFAVGFGLSSVLGELGPTGEMAGSGNDSSAGALASPTLNGVVWLCAGLPLSLRVSWLFGRGRWLALGIGCLLWFGPMLSEHDQSYVFLLRFFASFVACASLLVWRTLWTLTRQ